MLRTSSYVIYVDLPDNSEEMLLVHGYTGSYDRVSRPVANFLRSREPRRAPKPLYGNWNTVFEKHERIELPSEGTVEVLQERGYLTERSVDQERDFFRRLALARHERSLRQMPTYLFIPTYDCNLRCSYCFQEEMRTDPKLCRLLRSMEPRTVDRIFHGILEIEELHEIGGDAKRHRKIGFFGGEPLLARNRPIVEYVMKKALDLGTASFWGVSNATELDAYQDLLSPEGIAKLQVTLDGPPPVHDTKRIYPDGSGSFERIARNLSMALEQGVHISVRLNIDRANVDQLPQVAREIRDRGWDEHDNFSAYAAVIYAANENTDRKSTMSTRQLDEALTELRETWPEMNVIDRPDDIMRHRARRLFADPENEKAAHRESYCSANDRQYLFDSFGDIYACWDKTGDPSVSLGRIDEEGHLRLKPHVHDLWRQRTVASNPVCSQCRYAFNCGGGCAILAQLKTKKLHMNHCDDFGKRFRACVAEAFLAHVQNPEGADAHTHRRRLCE